MLPTLLLTLACRAPAGPPPIPDPAPALELSATLAEDMGGEGLGFIHASSANGRLVVMRRWAPGVTPSFGHHGEASPEPELVLLDLRAGAERVLDEIVDVSADRRHLLVLDEGRMWRVDAETGAWEGLDADTEDDGNACLPPRGASFWSSGRHLAVIEPDAQALSVRDLSNGQTRRFPAEGRVWRGGALPDGEGAWLMEVTGAKDWPVQNTSCACWWCNRFALSYGMYGWGGREWTLVAVDAQGARTPLESLPEGDATAWHGPSADGCALTPAAPEDERYGLAPGPWRWVCEG